MRHSGFTIVELVVVIILVALLVAIALPRFLAGYDKAEAARLETIAGALQNAAHLAKGQWVAQGKPNSVVLRDGRLVNLDPSVGFPVDDRDHANDTFANMGIAECRRVFTALITTAETATNSNNANNIRASSFYVRRVNGGGANPDTCVYYHVSEALIADRPNNAGIDARYPALVYTPFDGVVTAVNLP